MNLRKSLSFCNLKIVISRRYGCLHLSGVGITSPLHCSHQIKIYLRARAGVWGLKQTFDFMSLVTVEFKINFSTLVTEI